MQTCGLCPNLELRLANDEEARGGDRYAKLLGTTRHRLSAR
jgi:hypothetical protein